MVITCQTPQDTKAISRIPRLFKVKQSFRSRLRLKCDSTRAETILRLSAKRTCPFKSAGASVHSTTGSQVVRISSSNTGHTIFRGSVKSNGYPLHSPVSRSLTLPCVTVCHHISSGLYLWCPWIRTQRAYMRIAWKRNWHGVQFCTLLHIKKRMAISQQSWRDSWQQMTRTSMKSSFHDTINAETVVVNMWKISGVKRKAESIIR